MRAVDMTLGELMSPSVKTIAPEVTLGEAARLMSDPPLSCLVVHHQGRLLGIVTERDMVTLLHERVVYDTPVSAIMTSPVITAAIGDTFRDGLMLMRQYALRHLVVTDEAGEVVGVVSESDMRRHLGMGIVGRMRNLFTAMDRQSPKFSPDTPVCTALQRMVFEHWDYVMVTQDDMPLGILTERDVPHLLGDRADVTLLTMSQVMTSPLTTIVVEADLFDAVKLMTASSLRHLVVIDEHGRYLGVISQHGLLERIGLELIGDSLYELEALRTERKIAEQELREREEIYSTLVNQAADAIVLIDSETLGFAEFNAVAHEGLGYTREEFAALTLFDLQVGVLQEQVRQRMALTLNKTGGDSFVVKQQRKDGSARLMQVSARPVGIRGKGYISVIWHDITAQKKAEQALMESEARYRLIADNTDDVIWMMNLSEGKFTYVSPSVEKLRGYTAEEVMAQPAEAALTAESSRKVAEVMGRTLEAFATNHQAERVVTTEVEQPHKDGSIVHTEVVTKLLTDEGGQPVAILGVTRDITQRKITEAQIKLAASVFHDVREGIMITDAEGAVINVNQAFTAITGFQREEVFGLTPRILKSGRHEREFYTKLWQQLLQTDQWSGELWNCRKNGEEYPQQLSISAVKDAAGKTTHYVGIFTDITEHKQQQEQIERLAYFDALTRLPNRVMLADRMQQALARADRLNKIVAVCYLDLDGFKPINDRYGHKAGDGVLTEIALRLQKLVRAEDTVARLGGDEFVLLLTDLSHERESEPVLARVLETITAPCELHDGVKVNVSASVGVTFYPTDHNDSDMLLRHADQAMYQAKQLGRNRMHFFDPQFDQLTQKLRELKAKVRIGLAQGDFLLYWQPKVDLVRGHVVGAEALLRWKLADSSIRMPGTFLPQLENDELIVTIGDFVIKEGVAALSRWQELGLNMSASVNVAARQMLSPDFMLKLHDALDGRVDIAANLELEILETAALEDLDTVKRLINECRALGVSTALDDFGTGYSSMTHFRHLPVDTVKIDQSFVRDMLNNVDDLAIVQGILGLTKAFGKTSVAEGVEFQEHLAVLRNMGCHHAQGYAIGHPMPEQEFLRWVADFEPDMTWSMDVAPLKIHTTEIGH